MAVVGGVEGLVFAHRLRQDGRGVLRALHVDHVLHDAGDALRALDELGAEALVGSPLVRLRKVVVTEGVGDSAHEAVADPNQEKRVEH